MLIYIIVLIGIIFLGIILEANSNINRKVKNIIFLTSSFLVLTIIAAIRTELIGVDTFQYCRAYSIIGQTFTFNTDGLRYEVGFKYLCTILYKISTEPQFLIIITSIIINSSIAIFIYRNSKNVVLSTIFYITLNFYFSYMNIMRQALAIVILLFAYEAIKNKKHIIYFLLVALATVFHSSAILGLLYIFMEKIKYKKQYNKYIIPILIIIFLFGNNIIEILSKLSSSLNMYINSEEFGVSNYFGALINFGLIFIILIFGNAISSKNKEIDKIKEMQFFQEAVIIATIFSILTMRIVIVSRFTEYFSIFIIVWLTNILVSMKKNKQIFIILFVLFFIIYWFVIMVFRPEWYGVVPYESIL